MLGYLTGLTETLTEKAAALPLSTIENIGMVTIESILLFSFIFLFTLVILNRKIFPLRYPLFAFLLFLLAGTIRSISDRTSGELIVYNGIGSSPIGIRTGRVLNLYSDTDTLLPEVAKHCFTRRLKINLIKSDAGVHLLKVNKKSILICNDLSTNVLQKAKPDIIILKGKYPKVDKEIDFHQPVEGLIITSEVASGYRLKLNLQRGNPDTIHYVKNSGAFRKRI
jgi:hypothetical protein